MTQLHIQHMNETKIKKENKNSKTSCYYSHFTTNFSQKTFIKLKNISYRHSCKVIWIQDSLKKTLKQLFESLCTVEVFETKEAIFGTEIGWLCCKKSFQQVSKEIIAIGGLFPSRSLEMWFRFFTLFPFFFRTYYNLTLLALSMPYKFLSMRLKQKKKKNLSMPYKKGPHQRWLSRFFRLLA